MTERNEKVSWGEVCGSIGAIVGVLVVLAFVGLLFFRMLWVTKIENYELGFVWDKVTGKIEVIDRQGWIVRTPIRYSVHAIDMRPHQITISANQRVLNAKLVRFNPKGLETFVEWHGRSAGDETENLQEILKCYAFDLADGKDCPFLEVIQEIAPNQGGIKTPHNIVMKGEKGEK